MAPCLDHACPGPSLQCCGAQHALPRCNWVYPCCQSAAPCAAAAAAALGALPPAHMVCAPWQGALSWPVLHAPCSEEASCTWPSQPRFLLMLTVAGPPSTASVLRWVPPGCSASVSGGPPGNSSATHRFQALSPPSYGLSRPWQRDGRVVTSVRLGEPGRPRPDSSSVPQVWIYWGLQA